MTGVFGVRGAWGPGWKRAVRKWHVLPALGRWGLATRGLGGKWRLLLPVPLLALQPWHWAGPRRQVSSHRPCSRWGPVTWPLGPREARTHWAVCASIACLVRVRNYWKAEIRGSEDLGFAHW